MIADGAAERSVHVVECGGLDSDGHLTDPAENSESRRHLRLVRRGGILTIGGVPVGPIFGGTMPGMNGKLAPEHLEQLAKSGISPEFAAQRGYETILNATCLKRLGLAKAAQTLVPGLMFPLRHADETVAGWQYRPDNPRLRKGKPAKYEIPVGQSNVIDVPPGVGGWLGDPNLPLWITEGTKKADSGAQRGLCIVAINGVYGWLGTNSSGGKTALPDWRDIALNGRQVILAFDNDVWRKKQVYKALREFAAWLGTKGARVEYLWLPDDGCGKIGLDDYLVDRHTTADLYGLVKDKPPGDDGHGKPALGRSQATRLVDI